MSAFDSLTDQINGLLQVDPSWKSIPGGLSKVSTSSLGFSWGISSQNVYYCRLPCSGEWTNVPIPDTVVDIITDDSHVYVLGKTTFMSKLASNMEDWIVIPAPSGAVSILSTSSNIWAQDASGKKWKLAKPGTTGNWIAVDDTSGTILTSASGSSLYGIQSGKAVKSDESLQSGWSPLAEFEGTMTKVFGDLDKTALYGLDSKNSLSRCASGTCANIDTPGTPQNLSIDSKGTLWMTTTTQGVKGNIYTKPDSLTLPDTSELDKQRDAVVHEAQINYQKRSVEQTLQDIVEFLGKLIKKPEDTSTSKQEEKIIRNRKYLDRMNILIPVMMHICLYIGGVALLYIFLGEMDWIAHILALGILGFGVYDVYFLYGKQ
jgi:hypothetical protein